MCRLTAINVSLGALLIFNFIIVVFPEIAWAQDIGSMVDRRSTDILQFLTGPLATMVCVVGMAGGLINIIWSQGQSFKTFLIIFGSGVALFMLEKIIAGMRALGQS